MVRASTLARVVKGSTRRLILASRDVVVIYGVLGILIIVASFASPYFLTKQNLLNVLVQGVALGIVSVGQTFVLLAAGIDLSAGSVVTAADCMAAAMMRDSGLSIVSTVFACLVLGVGIGVVNGLGVIKLRVSPFIMTLATMSAVQGMAFFLRPYPGGYIPRVFVNLADAKIGFLPLPVLFLAFIAALGIIVLRTTSFGLHVYATGGNESSARLSGVKVDRVKIATYTICGFTAALAGVFLAARTGTGDPALGQAYSFDSITAVLLGGTDLFGGQGGIGGTIAGVFIIGVLSNTFNLLNVSAYYQWMIKGAILILATAFYIARGRH